MKALGAKSSLTGLVLGALLGFGTALFVLPLGPTRWIIFPEKRFFDWTAVGGDYLTIQGRLNDSPAYPNNLVHITCRKSSNNCELLKIEEIDQPDKSRGAWPQIGDIDPPELYKIVNWDKSSLVAIGESDKCESKRLNVDLVRYEAEVVVQPVNLADIECKTENPNISRQPIEDSLNPFQPKK
jgi:hypothetical protein